MRRTALWFISLLVLLCLSPGVSSAQQIPETGVTVLANRDGVNVRLFPAIGAEVIGFVNAGWTAPATGRSADNEWIRVDFSGQEGWVGFPAINIFGDINALPVADPRTIPYGGFESPRAGTTSATSQVMGRLDESGLRIRSGPSTAYVVLGNAPRRTELPLLGRTFNNAWLQVNYLGTLGWVSTQYVTFTKGTIVDLPIDGITADAVQPVEGTNENYIGTLRFMLARIDLAQPSLDQIRGTWTTVALGENARCGGYPARPTDYVVPNPILAANYPVLNPLLIDFNNAMANTRLAIDLFQDVCEQFQPPQGIVGVATVQGALDVVNLADAQYADLRRRINELLPDDEGLGPDECLFTFQGLTDILKIVVIGQARNDELNASNPFTGYCVDVAAGRTLRFEILTTSGNGLLFLAVSPIDNPSNFIATGRATQTQGLLTVSPVAVPAAGRYLILVADTDTVRNDPLQSSFAILVSDITGITPAGPGLSVDLATGNVIVNPVTGAATSSTPIATVAPSTGATATPSSSVACPSVAFTCSQLFSCEEARACLAAGNRTLDENNNGIPCEEILCVP
jgi:uncharacterized protein YraI